MLSNSYNEFRPSMANFWNNHVLQIYFYLFVIASIKESDFFYEIYVRYCNESIFSYLYKLVNNYNFVFFVFWQRLTSFFIGLRT